MSDKAEMSAAEKRVEETRRKLLGGGEGVDRKFGDLDPRTKNVILPEPCPKCGSDFTDPDSRVINHVAVRGLTCQDCWTFFEPKPEAGQ